MPGRDSYTVDLDLETSGIRGFRQVRQILRDSARFSQVIRNNIGTAALVGGAGGAGGGLGNTNLNRYFAELPRQTQILRRIERHLRGGSIAGRSGRQVYNQSPFFGYPGNSPAGARGRGGRGDGNVYNQSFAFGSQAAAGAAYGAGRSAAGGGWGRAAAGFGALAGAYGGYRGVSGAYRAGAQQEAWEIGFRNVGGGSLRGLELAERFNARTPFSSQQLNPLMMGLMAAFGGDTDRAFSLLKNSATLGALATLRTGTTSGFDSIAYHMQAAASRGLVQTEQWNEIGIRSGVPLNQIARKYAIEQNKGTPTADKIRGMSEGEWSNWMRKRLEKGLLMEDFEKLIGFAAGQYPNALYQASQTQAGKQSTLESNVFLALAEVGKAFQPVTKDTLDALTRFIISLQGIGDTITRNLELGRQASEAFAGSSGGKLIGSVSGTVGEGWSWYSNLVKDLTAEAYLAMSNPDASDERVRNYTNDMLRGIMQFEGGSRAGNTGLFNPAITVEVHNSVSPGGGINTTVKSKDGSDVVEMTNGGQ